MGQSCASHLPTQARIVTSLGIKKLKGEDIVDEVDIGDGVEHKHPSLHLHTKDGLLNESASGVAGFRHILKCPEGHVMRAKVAREMFNVCAAVRECDSCNEECDNTASYYVCKKCEYIYCNPCAREELGLPELGQRGDVLEIQPGDIFLAGPDKFGIHHVILVTSGWVDVDVEIAEILQLEPGADIVACSTIESTQGSIGEETWWYPTTTYFLRDQATGVLNLVADLPPRSNVLEQAETPVPTKILLNPFRPQNGGPQMKEDVFAEVVHKAAGRSVRYGKRTAVRSVLTGLLGKETIERSEYITDEQKEGLAKKLKKTWKARPICASVAVMCWQQYFFKASSTQEEAIEQVLQYMPHWCDRSTPSSMVKNLTQRGWILTDTADGN